MFSGKCHGRILQDVHCLPQLNIRYHNHHWSQLKLTKMSLTLLMSVDMWEQAKCGCTYMSKSWAGYDSGAIWPSFLPPLTSLIKVFKSTLFIVIDPPMYCISPDSAVSCQDFPAFVGMLHFFRDIFSILQSVSWGDLCSLFHLSIWRRRSSLAASGYAYRPHVQPI